MSRLVQPRQAAPALVVGGVAAAVWLAFGVPAGDVARYAAYHLGLVLIPGVLFSLALGPAGRRLGSHLVIGWAFGYLWEYGAFSATAAMGARPLLPVLTALAAVSAGAVALRRYRQDRAGFVRPVDDDARAGWSVAALCALAMVYVCATYFIETPLPSDVTRANYYTDLPWHLGNAAESLRHASVTDPRVSGEPHVYYLLTQHHLAATSQVTGIALPEVLFRLYAIPAVIACVLGLYRLGHSLGRRPLAGALTAVLVLFVGEIDLDPGRIQVFNNYFFRLLTLSPTFLMALVFWIPFAQETASAVDKPDARRVAAVVLMTVGWLAAKATALPVALGGLALVGAARATRRADARAPLGVALILAAVAAPFVAAYSANPTGAAFDPLDSIRTLAGVEAWRGLPVLSRLPRAAFEVLATTPALFGFMGLVLVGIGIRLAAARLRIGPAEGWHLALFAAGLIGFLSLSSTNGIQLIFMMFGLVSASAVGAQGLTWLWDRLRSGPSPLQLVAAALALVLGVLGALDVPLDHAANVRLWLQGRPVPGSYHNAVSRGVLDALAWLRANAPADAVVAVNNQMAGNLPAYFSYSAFSERRVFLEGWLYTTQAYADYDNVARLRALPYPERQALNRAVFEQGDADALRVLRDRHGVRFLFVDRAVQRGAVRLPAGIALRASNAEAEVYEVLE